MLKHFTLVALMAVAPAYAACGYQGKPCCYGNRCKDGSKCMEGVCKPMDPPPPDTCGNGDIDDGEECEPPNRPGCDGSCQFEPCPDNGDPCPPPNECPPDPDPGCGNNIVEPGEECEPPNTDGCDANCKIPPGPDPPGPPKCGDGIVNGDEDCEPPSVGNCNDECKIPPTPECGDNIVQDGEDCEPPGVGNCNDMCKIPPAPDCGDGIIQGDEECEPPGRAGCDENCKIADDPPPPTTTPPTGPCLTCDDKGKPISVTLQWTCDGAPPGSINVEKSKGATPQYDASTGVVTFAGGKKLGSQIDFNGESLHTSCSAPFGLGVKTFTGGDKKQQGNCNRTNGCWTVIDATADSGGTYCELCPR